tara:strand:+ start:1066 stop:1683 length:618 start_codon:yes stop_codon:yes gene_type:complete
MIHRLLTTTLVASLLVGIVLQSTSATNAADKKGFVQLKSLEKDFFVAFGDAKSWKVNGDVIECTGKPNGYICTKKSYSNYILTFEFRYPKQKGNSGVLNYIAGKHKIWPACVEVQGHYDNLGMIFAMGGAKGPRNNGDKAAREKSRKPHTEWNKLHIVSENGVLTAKLNGVLIAKSGPYINRKGPFGLQSEGAPIHFRNIMIKEL